uniref:Uncharacterized protein n=1 Tax=Globodera pallida TaxID=36090 RepID=A0A183CN29_GLOPA
MIIGNSLSSLLRVVSVSGATPGEYNEKIYDSPIFARVLPREIGEIEIELRTMDNGVGDIFRGVWRFFLPILKRVGTTVGAEALSTGQRVLERVGNEGIPLKEAVVSEGKRGLDTVLEKGGLPKQFGTGKILGLKMYVKKVSLMDGLALDIARKLELKPARYAVRKTTMKSMFISEGRFEFIANMFMDQIPRRITLGLVANADYIGTQSRSPFNFQPFNVREISVIANGRSYPQAPYDLDYPNKKYVRPFNDMNEAVGFTNTLESNGITFDQYGKTHCMYVFNLTSSGDDQVKDFHCSFKDYHYSSDQYCSF